MGTAVRTLGLRLVRAQCHLSSCLLRVTSQWDRPACGSSLAALTPTVGQAQDRLGHAQGGLSLDRPGRAQNVPATAGQWAVGSGLLSPPAPLPLPGRRSRTHRAEPRPHQALRPPRLLLRPHLLFWVTGRVLHSQPTPHLRRFPCSLLSNTPPAPPASSGGVYCLPPPRGQGPGPFSGVAPVPAKAVTICPVKTRAFVNSEFAEGFGAREPSDAQALSVPVLLRLRSHSGAPLQSPWQELGAAPGVSGRRHGHVAEEPPRPALGQWATGPDRDRGQPHQVCAGRAHRDLAPEGAPVSSPFAGDTHLYVVLNPTDRLFGSVNESSGAAGQKAHTRPSSAFLSVSERLTTTPFTAASKRTKGLGISRGGGRPVQCKPQNRRESKAGVDGTRARGWETPPPPAPSTWGPVRAGLPWGSDTPSGVGRGALAFLLSVLAVSDLLSYRLFEKSFLRGFLLWYNTHDETGGPRRLCVRRHCALL